MKKPLLFPAVLLAALMPALPAGNAFAQGLTGATVKIDYLYPTIKAVYTTLGTGKVTNSGYTVNAFGNDDYTVTGSTISVTTVNTQDVTYTEADFNGYRLSVLSGGASITNITIDPATTQAGFGPERISFDATHVYLNMEGLVSPPGLNVKLDLDFTSAVTGLCNSGQTAATASGCTGVLVPPNSDGGGPNRDGNWDIAYPYPLPLSRIKPPCMVTSYIPAWVDTPNGSWLPNSASTASEWIMPFDGENDLGQGWYAYRTNFPIPSALPGGGVPTGMTINGQLASDNVTVWIYLRSPANSGECELVLPSQPFPVNPYNGPTFEQWWPFSFTNRTPITPGADASLYFVVVNEFNSGFGGPSPTGLRVEFFSSSVFH